MESLEDKLEEAAFYNHDSNRAVAVVWPAIVENRLTDLLRAALIPAPKEFEELFAPGRPLGDFGLKIKLAYITGLIGSDMVNDLKLLARIRNAFAHQVAIDDFEKPPVCDWLNSMHATKVNRELLARLVSIPEEQLEERQKLTLSILQGETCDYRNIFHACIRYLIHQIVRNERARKEHNQELIRSGGWVPE